MGLYLSSNNFEKNSLLRPLTASSKVNRTNCGISSFVKFPGMFMPPQKQFGNWHARESQVDALCPLTKRVAHVESTIVNDNIKFRLDDKGPMVSAK